MSPNFPLSLPTLRSFHPLQRSTLSWGVLLVVVSLFVCVPVTALAQNKGASDEVESEDWGNEDAEEDWGGGGEDEWGDDVDVAVGAEPSVSNSPVSLTGFARSDWGVWSERLQDDPFAKGRQSLDLELGGRFGFFQFKAQLHGEYDLAYLQDRETQDPSTLDTYEWQVLARDVFVAFSLGQVELTIGRQIVAWGEGDSISPLDIVNPRDLREPGLADLDDIRMSTLSTRLGWFFGDHRIEAMVIHEADFGLRSPPKGPFGGFDQIVSSSPQSATLLDGKEVLWNDVQPRFSLDGQQGLLRWVYKGPGVDLGLYGARVLDRQGVILFPDFTSDPRLLSAFVASDTFALQLDHRPYGVVGTSGASSFGEWLVKWELGLQLDRSINTGDSSAAIPALEVESASLVDLMLGITWSPISDLILGLEVGKSTFFDAPDDLLFPLDEPTMALRMSWLTLRQRLKLFFVASALGLGEHPDFILRGEVSYEVIDTLSAGLGFVSYLPGEDLGLISSFTEHDRIFLKLRWGFTLL